MTEGNDNSEIVGPSSTVSSLFAKLHCPQPADITRKGKVAIYPSLHGKCRSARHGNFHPKSALPLYHILEFPDEQLTVSAGKLFFQACGEKASKKLT